MGTNSELGLVFARSMPGPDHSLSEVPGHLSSKLLSVPVHLMDWSLQASWALQWKAVVSGSFAKLLSPDTGLKANLVLKNMNSTPKALMISEDFTESLGGDYIPPCLNP
jgi:hypothetical protein